MTTCNHLVFLPTAAERDFVLAGLCIYFRICIVAVFRVLPYLFTIHNLAPTFLLLTQFFFSYPGFLVSPFLHFAFVTSTNSMLIHIFSKF